MSVDSLTPALAHLQLDAHPAVAAALREAHALALQRRYRQAEQQLRAYLTTTQQQLQAAKQQAAAAAAGGDAPAPAADGAPLPTLSQLLTGVLPQLRVLATLQREADSADYDLRVMQVETEQYRRQAAAAAAAAAPSSAPPPSRPLHAEYVHPRVQVAAIAGRSRGLIASSQAAAAGAAAACAVAASAGPPPVCLPAHTTVLCCKAVGLVTDSPSHASDAAAESAPAGAAMSSASREERMASALVTLLALKMQSQPSLIPQLYQLDAGERYEEDRSRRLAERSPLAPYRVNNEAADTTSDLSAGVEAVTDLEIDIERLALIVARNAFAPPSDSALQGGAGEEASGGNGGAGAASSGVWLTCSLLNHSCKPNAHWFCVGDVMFVRTLRDVHEGEELTISYTGFDAKLYLQRRALCAGWDFECHCAAWCEPMEAHPQLVQAEESFVSETGALEKRVHELVSTMHSSDEGTLTHRRAMADLTAAKETLERLIDAFRRQVAGVCGPHCVANGVACAVDAEPATTPAPATLANEPATEGDGEVEGSGAAGAGGVAPTTSAAKKKKKKKKAGASPAAPVQPVHTQQLLLHLAMPLSLLALCHSSLHDGGATAASYTAALQRHESLSMEAIGVLERQYGSGDETVIFAWFELLNTWLQFLSAGIEYRSIEQMKAVINLCVNNHCAQFGAKPDHFRHTWMHLLTSMGLAELLEE